MGLSGAKRTEFMQLTDERKWALIKRDVRLFPFLSVLRTSSCAVLATQYLSLFWCQPHLSLTRA